MLHSEKKNCTFGSMRRASLNIEQMPLFIMAFNLEKVSKHHVFSFCYSFVEVGHKFHRMSSEALPTFLRCSPNDLQLLFIRNVSVLDRRLQLGGGD